ncbi:uracil-DNA glycosylase [Nocardioides albidus]|uniref:Uracil-DNA glycosylase n=1 Tax=Nocardioides albidus TaxID=1517589 RepID=A0A5C4VUE1_9ACTN|nr:uracil-DNA glycosylase [Nocardioides albidus]TNM39447.1 uracil-DNA glycosylase [Nocardioides albidus]
MSEIFGDEAFELLADEGGRAAAAADVSYVRRQRRLRDRPTMSLTEAVRRANDHLRSKGINCVVTEDKALANPAQDLWILGYRDPDRPDEILCGGGLIVRASGEIGAASSLPDGPELIGTVPPPDDEEDWMLPERWEEVLDDWMRSPRRTELMEFVDRAYATGTVYPPREKMLRAFELTSYDDVRVVIVGQDPYPGAGHADGLAFSTPQSRKLPSSLRKIFDVLEQDLDVTPTQGSVLEPWARQGVLLLNTVLTLDAEAETRSNSHRKRGWEDFTDAVIRALDKRKERVVFLLWGEPAKKKATLVTNPQHVVIPDAHPAARSTALQQFGSSQPFKQANEALAAAGLPTVEWGVSQA